MENLINLLKTHKKVAILVPIILLISIAIIVLFTSVTLSHFKNLNLEENTVLASNATNLAGNIAIASDDFLFVETLDINEKSEEEKAEDTEKDKEEEKKAKEEEEKKSKEQEEKNKNNSQKENNNQNTVSSNPYYIKINRQANTVTVYTKDANGNYTVPVRAMVCSTGYASPTGGVYSMRKLGTWHSLMGGVYGQYCTQITGDFLFHSVPYLTRGDNASLEYWAYDRLGTTASAGCVRLTTADAQWIYYNCSNGTKVEFYSSSTPGPLGKPTATKISDAGEPYRNWDPTDPNPNNPWRNKQTQVQQVQNQTQSQNQQSSSENTSSSNNSSVTITSIENTIKQNTNSNTKTTNNTVNTDSKNKTNTSTNTSTNTTINNVTNKTNTINQTSNNNTSNTNNSSNNTVNSSENTTNNNVNSNVTNKTNTVNNNTNNNTNTTKNINNINNYTNSSNNTNTKNQSNLVNNSVNTNEYNKN